MSDGVCSPAFSIIINSLEGPKSAMKYFPSEFVVEFGLSAVLLIKFLAYQTHPTIGANPI